MEKRILIVGPNYFGYNESVAFAFKELGWETKIIDYYDAFPKNIKNFLSYSIMPRLKVNHFTEKYKRNINNSILAEMKSYKPSIVLFIKGSYLDEETLKAVNKEAKSVLWMMDSVYRFKETYKMIKEFNYRFMFEETDVKKLESENIPAYFLPMAADTNNYYPIANTSKVKDIDLLFVGKLYPNRKALFERLIKKYPDLNIKIYGKYTSLKNPKSIIEYKFTNLKRYYTNQFVSPKELNELYSRSKIALNIHHSQSQSGCNPRVFEILAAKSFQLVDEIPYVKEHFQDGELLGSYNSEDELIRKVEYYLSKTEEREKIAENGYNNILRNHTFVIRAKKILEIIQKESLG